MIYTIVLNPALDRIVDIDELLYDDVNTIIEETRLVSGKAIDVSRVIRKLGGQSCLLGLAGGYNGFEVEGRLLAEGLVCELVRLSRETKTNIAIRQTRKNLRTIFSTADPQVSPIELSLFHDKVRDIPEDSFVVMSGSLVPGVSENFYAQIITALAGKNVRTILDADGEALKRGVESRPFLIKPNIHEFGRLVEKNVREVDDILDNIDSVLELVPHIVVSMGARGAVAVSRAERYHVVPPKVSVKSSMGAGDALVGGIVYSLSRGSSFIEAVTLGVACGTASTLNGAGGFCSLEDTEKIRKEVLVKNF